MAQGGGVFRRLGGLETYNPLSSPAGDDRGGAGANPGTQRRPCERRDPYAATSRFGAVADGFLSNEQQWLWVPAFAGTTDFFDHTHLHLPAARMRPSCACILASREKRAQGMPGARCTRSLVCRMKKHTSIVTTVTPASPGIPRAMVLTVSFVLLVTGLFCHRRLAGIASRKT